MKTLAGLGAAALICFIAGCSSQPPVNSTRPSAASNALPSTPLQEPFGGVLARWNYYRASAGVPPIAADPALNEAALHHAKYLVNNHIEAGDAVIQDGR